LVPADSLIDLVCHPKPPDRLSEPDLLAAADFLKTTLQMERRNACQEERQRYSEVCRDYLQRSYDARIRAAQDRVMALRLKEAESPEMALARQRAEQDYSDLQRTHRERLEGLQRLVIARHGPVRHIATALVLPASMEDAPELADELDPEIRRQIEIAAET
jgi:hypothetical protein